MNVWIQTVFQFDKVKLEDIKQNVTTSPDDSV